MSLISIADAAREFKIHRATIYRYIKRGRLNVYHTELAQRTWVDREELLQLSEIKSGLRDPSEATTPPPRRWREIPTNRFLTAEESESLDATYSAWLDKQPGGPEHKRRWAQMLKEFKMTDKPAFPDRRDPEP